MILPYDSGLSWIFYIAWQVIRANLAQVQPTEASGEPDTSAGQDVQAPATAKLMQQQQPQAASPARHMQEQEGTPAAKQATEQATSAEEQPEEVGGDLFCDALDGAGTAPSHSFQLRPSMFPAQNESAPCRSRASAVWLEEVSPISLCRLAMGGGGGHVGWLHSHRGSCHDRPHRCR